MESETTFDPAVWEDYRSWVPKGADPDPFDDKAQDLRTDIIIAYVYLCRRVVGKMKKSMPAHVERDDLESWAKIGLMQAVQRYDHTMGVPFEAFATQRMRSVIMDGIRDADWAPRSLRKKQRDITKVEEDFRQAQGRDPSAIEVARMLVFERVQKEELMLTPEQFEAEAVKALGELADTKYQSDIASHTYIEGSLEAQNKPASLNDEEDELVDLLKSVVGKAMRNLPIRKATIVALHYYEEKKLSDIAELLKMSEVKVGTLHSEAVMEIWDSLKRVLADV